MVNLSLTGALSTQQFDRAAVNFIAAYPARNRASDFNCIYQPDISQVYLAWKKVEGIAQSQTFRF